MIYRMRVYQAVTDKLDDFNYFFRDWLLPVQERHGARLVGRWATEDARVVAIWEYDSREHYERVDLAVRSDPHSRAAMDRRTDLGTLFTAVDETFMRSTLG